MPEEAPSGRGGVRGHRPSDRSVRPGLVAAPALLNALIHRSAWKGYSEKFGCLLEPRFIHILASLCATTTCSVASYASRCRECAITLA
jgi:hypothetical protein